MPSVQVTAALWDRLWTLWLSSHEPDQTITDLVDELLSEAVMEREVTNG